MRIALMVEYDGSQYHGWQAQTGLHTVQQVLEDAVSQVADRDIEVVCAGRTDTGVHATNQIVHFDCESIRSVRAWIHGANSFLPKDVCVKWCREMPDDFHARYSALSRRYRYLLYNSPVRPALLRCNVAWQYRPLDYLQMQEASQSLLGEHDFTSFRALECQSRTPMRNIHSIRVARKGDLISIDIEANAFLHHMVRNIVGVLMAIGSGRQAVSWAGEVLSAKDRKLGAETAPPYGLYLIGVKYPTIYAVPEMETWPISLLGALD